MTNFNIGLSIIILLSLSTLTQTEEISIGKIRIVTHKTQSVIGQDFKLTPLAYNEHLPNLQMLKIRVVKADPYDGCSQLNTSKIFSSQDSSTDTFVLVDGKEGGCKYWRKSEMARLSWVKGIIIVDDDHIRNANQNYDYNNGHFFSFLIKPEDAQKIMPADDESFEAKLSISQVQAQKKTPLYLWLSSLNRQSYKIIQYWNQTLINVPELKNNISWEPKYVFYGKSTKNMQVKSCACQGLFCSPQYKQSSPDILIKEDIRQKLIFKQNPQKYMIYLEYFIERCLESYLVQKEIEQCAQSQMLSAGINATQINNKVYTFLSQCDKDEDLFGEFLIDKGRFSMIVTYPAVLLNRETLNFTNQDELQTLLCNKFHLQSTDGCMSNERINKKQIVVSIVFFLLILAGLFGVGFFVVMCYKNKLRKQMSKQVTMQVSTAVEHYFQLSQESTASNKK